MGNSWDYGQADQVMEEWTILVNNGYCHTCLRNKVPDDRECWQCREDESEARDRFDAYDNSNPH